MCWTVTRVSQRRERSLLLFMPISLTVLPAKAAVKERARGCALVLGSMVVPHAVWVAESVQDSASCGVLLLVVVKVRVVG